MTNQPPDHPTGDPAAITATFLFADIAGLHRTNRGDESRGRQTLRNVRDPVELVAAIRQGHASDRRLAIDPVCRMAVDPDHAAGRLNYEDATYFFCTLTCAGEFARHPDRFAERPREAYGRS